MICPFGGPAESAGDVVARLSTIALRAGDQVLLVDNTPDQVAAGSTIPPVEVVSAEEERSSYFARNRGARRASCPWLLFIDADCIPSTTILDHYLASAVPEGCGLIAGAVLASTDEESFVGRYSRVRGILDQSHVLQHPFRPYAATANVLVRAEAFREIGGFREGIRSGATPTSAGGCRRRAGRSPTGPTRPCTTITARARPGSGVSSGATAPALRGSTGPTAFPRTAISIPRRFSASEVVRSSLFFVGTSRRRAFARLTSSPSSRASSVGAAATVPRPTAPRTQSRL